MSEFEQDSSANTGRFRAFVERGDEDRPRSRGIPPAALVAVGVAVVIVIVLVVAL
jgi:hypothetical protein